MSFNPDEILKDNILLRQKMAVSNLEADGAIPADPAKQELLLKILDSTDRVIIANKRIKVDEKSNDLAQRSNEIIGQVLKGLHGTDIFAIEGTSRVIPVPTEQLVDDLYIAPGELEIGTPDNNYNDFIAPHLK